MAEANDKRTLLENLRARKAALDKAITALEELAALEGEAGDTVTLAGASTKSSAIEVDTFIGLNINQAAEKYLQMTGKPAKTTEQIAAALNQGGLSVSQGSVSTILRRSDNGESPVIRVGRSLWGLASWYPNRPRRSRQASEEGE